MRPTPRPRSFRFRPDDTRTATIISREAAGFGRCRHRVRKGVAGRSRRWRRRVAGEARCFSDGARGREPTAEELAPEACRLLHVALVLGVARVAGVDPDALDEGLPLG